MRKLTTKEMEHLIYRTIWKQGQYACFEVKMPDDRGTYFYNNERVDLLAFEIHGGFGVNKGIWRMYELKLSVSDFHSDNKITFLGHYNYYVMPYELYEKVKGEIPDWVGVYCIHTNKWGTRSCKLEKKPKKQELKVNHLSLMFSLLQSLSRENQKYRRDLYTKFMKEIEQEQEPEPEDDIFD